MIKFEIKNLNPFKIKSELDFKLNAIALFKKQFNNNLVYNQYCKLLKIKSSEVKELKHIPFLPIQFFKTHKIVSNKNNVSTCTYPKQLANSFETNVFPSPLPPIKQTSFPHIVDCTMRVTRLIMGACNIFPGTLGEKCPTFAVTEFLLPSS